MGGSYTRPPSSSNERNWASGRPYVNSESCYTQESTPHEVWPPTEELNSYYPKVGTKAGNVDISVRLSTICYLMHEHTEPSQSAQGGNYGLGIMSGIHFISPRKIPWRCDNFP